MYRGMIRTFRNFDYDKFLDDRLADSQGEEEDEIEMRRRRMQELDIDDVDEE